MWGTVSNQQKVYIIDVGPPLDLSVFTKDTFVDGIPNALQLVKGSTDETSTNLSPNGLDFWYNLGPELQVGIMNNYETFPSVLDFSNKDQASSEAYTAWATAIQNIWEKSKRN